MKNRALAFLMLVIVAGGLSGCSNTGYIVRAAFEQSKILLGRRSIDRVLSDPETSDAEREKLSLVRDARAFTEELGLTPGRSYTKYTKLDRAVLAWIVIAAPADSFVPYTWWFPIVGRVPYKGYFSEASAQAMAQELASAGYETAVRGTSALSTLGWFNDPVLSTTLAESPPAIVNTVIHETLHRTVWIPNYVDFNESLANFVGHRGTVEFYRRRFGNDSPLAREAALSLDRELKVSAVLDRLYRALNEIYQSGKPREEILLRRATVFNEMVGPLRKEYPGLRIFKTLNNAEIIQLHLYLKELHRFAAAFAAAGEQWPVFLAQMKTIATRIEDDATLDPWTLLPNPA